MCAPPPDFLGELCIGDQEAGDVVGVEEADEGVDFRVHDWLAHKREGTMFDLQPLLIPLQLDSRDTCKRAGITDQPLRRLQTVSSDTEPHHPNYKGECMSGVSHLKMKITRLLQPRGSQN